MKIVRSEIDSLVLGKTAVDVTELVCIEQVAELDAALADQNVGYAVTKVPCTDIGLVHALESAGFRFLEYQLQLSARLKKQYDVSSYPYRFERVLSEEALEPVLTLAANGFTEDRYSVDPAIAPGRSGERYQHYIRQSFECSDERVFRLISTETGETVAFKTHRLLDDTTAQLLLGAVRQGYRTAGIGVINEYFELNELHRSGIRRIIGRVSGRNLPVINLEVAGLGFRVDAAFVVLRRCDE